MEDVEQAVVGDSVAAAAAVTSSTMGYTSVNSAFYNDYDYNY